jgi:transposase
MDKSMLLQYMKRWDVEVDHLYLAMHCGMDDFECRKDEAILKYIFLCAVSLNFILWMNFKQGKKEALAETIRRFTKTFYSRNLKLAMRMLQQNYKWDTIIRKFNARAA